VTLDQVQIGSRAVISGVSAHSTTTLRLMELGMVPGMVVRVLKRAPFGGPMELQFPGWRLSVRSGEAKAFTVEAQ
jgi:ferrous iron transport protein A